MKKIAFIATFFCCLTLAFGLSSFVNKQNTMCPPPEGVTARFQCVSGPNLSLFMTWTNPEYSYEVYVDGTFVGFHPAGQFPLSFYLAPNTYHSILVLGSFCNGGTTVSARTPKVQCGYNTPPEPCDICSN